MIHVFLENILPTSQDILFCLILTVHCYLFCLILAVHCYVHRNTPMGPVLGQFNPFHNSCPILWYSVKCYLHTYAHISPSNFFCWSSPTKILYFSSVPRPKSFSPFHLPWASQPNNSALDEECKWWRLLLCNFHHSYVSSSFLFANILPTTFLIPSFRCKTRKSSQLTYFVQILFCFLVTSSLCLVLSLCKGKSKVVWWLRVMV